MAICRCCSEQLTDNTAVIVIYAVWPRAELERISIWGIGRNACTRRETYFARRASSVAASLGLCRSLIRLCERHVLASRTVTVLSMHECLDVLSLSVLVWPALQSFSDSAWARSTHYHSALVGDAYMAIEAERQARSHETELREREHSATIARWRAELQHAKSAVEKSNAELAARDRLLDQTRADATKLGAEGEARRVRDTDALRAQLSKLETELQDARNENAAVHSENKDLRAEERRLSEQVSKLEAKVSWLLFGQASEAGSAAETPTGDTA